MNSQLAFDALSNINALTVAMIGGLSAEEAYLSIAEHASHGELPFIDICQHLFADTDHKNDNAISTSAVAAAIESVVPELEHDAVSAKPEAAYIAQGVLRELHELQGANRNSLQAPAVFRHRTPAIVKRLQEAVSHQTLNPLQIVALSLQTLLEGAMSGDREQIQSALQATMRASQFVQGLASLTDPSSAGAPPSDEELAARVEALFQWRLQADGQGSGVYPVVPAATLFDGVILYVEDEADISDLMICIMQQSGFGNVRHADTAEAALDVFDDRVVLVVSDYRLPGMDGVDLSRRLREKRANLPIIFTSGSSGEIRDRLTPDELAETAILTKPFETSDLVKQMQKVLKPS